MCRMSDAIELREASAELWAEANATEVRFRCRCGQQSTWAEAQPNPCGQNPWGPPICEACFKEVAALKKGLSQ